MFSHERIWTALDRLAESTGYSTSGLAKRAGLDPTSFNRSKRFTPEGKPRWPSTESIARVLSVTGSTLTDFMALADAHADGSGAAPRAEIRQVPVLQLAKARMAEIFDENGFPKGDGWDMVSLPSLAANGPDRLYALRVSDASYLPLYRPDDLLLCAPNAKLRTGDRAALLRRSGQLWLCDVTDAAGDSLAVQSLSAERTTFSLPKADIVWLAKILWVSQ